jgi:hypothetical protein
MGQVRADHRDMTGSKGADIVARHQFSAAVADQMNLEFRVMVPARERVRIVVLVPAKALLRLRQDDFQFGRRMLEKTGETDRHGPLLFLVVIRSAQSTIRSNLSTLPLSRTALADTFLTRPAEQAEG